MSQLWFHGLSWTDVLMEYPVLCDFYRNWSVMPRSLHNSLQTILDNCFLVLSTCFLGLLFPFLLSFIGLLPSFHLTCSLFASHVAWGRRENNGYPTLISTHNKQKLLSRQPNQRDLHAAITISREFQMRLLEAQGDPAGKSWPDGGIKELPFQVMSFPPFSIKRRACWKPWKTGQLGKLDGISKDFAHLFWLQIDQDRL